MVDMGAEVGQKMRSAIKAKLTELNCYVDDELPDYIMVMVANKRTKSQMNEDLNLFLKNKTSTFVDWLHIVLKKLKEVTVTNLDVYKKASKRKSSELAYDKINEKKIKRETSKNIEETIVKKEVKTQLDKSLTDDLPFNVNVKSLADSRKIMLVADNPQSNYDQSFNIPSLCEIDQPSLKEMEEIETQIRSVKSRLGLKIDQEVEESELHRIVESTKNRPIAEGIFSNGRQVVIDSSKPDQISTSEGIEDNHENMEEPDSVNCVTKIRTEHSKIVFSKEEFRSPSKSPPRKKSVLDRLGNYGDKKSKSVLSRLGSYSKKRSSDTGMKVLKNGNGKRDLKSSHNREKNANLVRDKIVFNGKSGKDLRNQISHVGSTIFSKKDLKNRPGMSSKVTVPQIDPQLLEDTFKKREVVSVVKVKPRVLPPNVQQANKNLLLKAVADAQKSIAQSKSVGKEPKSNSSSIDSSAQKYKESLEAFAYKPKPRKVSQEGKEKLQQFLSTHGEESSDQEYTITPVKKAEINVQYIPTSLDRNTVDYDTNLDKKQKFIVTLDGIQKTDIITRLSAKDRLHGRRTPSPIIFDQKESEPKTERKIPEELPVVPVSFSKKKEMCKYFPSCKNGTQCEFFHPVKPVLMCEQFPFCKFGDRCHYIHPNCKFGTSCTKRDCSYAHSDGYGARVTTTIVPVKPQITKLQICRFFPKCININCSFYHPKPCKYGIYCKNQSICNYSHTNFPSKNSLTWRSK